MSDNGPKKKRVGHCPDGGFGYNNGKPNRTPRRENAETPISVKSKDDILSVDDDIGVSVIIIVRIWQWAVISVVGVVGSARLKVPGQFLSLFQLGRWSFTLRIIIYPMWGKS